MAIEERVYRIDKTEKKKLDDILAADPYAPVSFARIGTNIKEIEDKIYLYIKAETEFFKFAEEKFKELTTAKRAEAEKEKEIIEIIRKEEEEAAAGFGGVFAE